MEKIQAINVMKFIGERVPRYKVEQYKTANIIPVEKSYVDNNGEFLNHFYNENLEPISNIGTYTGTQLAFANGRLVVKGNYVDGKLQGDLTKYKLNGDLESTANFENGVKNGEEIVYFPQSQGGKKRWVYNYVDGVRVGQAKEYYESGELHVVCDYENNKRNGKIIGYYLSGKVMFTGTEKNDEENGEFRFYATEGHLDRIETYKDSEKTGPFKFYYKSGALYSEGNNVNNRLHGVVKKYEEDGTLKMEMLFDKGNRIE